MIVIFTEERKLASERRRLKRQQEKYANTTCFACREKGHAAKDCPKALASEAGANAGQKLGKQVVGICYRCVHHPSVLINVSYSVGLDVVLRSIH